MEGIGARIDRLRRVSGYSVSELAFNLGISHSYLWLILQDKRRLNLDILITLAEEFDVSLDYLVFGEERNFDLGDLYLLLARNVNKLNAEERLKFIELLVSFDLKD